MLPAAPSTRSGPPCCLGYCFDPALRKKRHATLGGAASLTISFCSHYPQHGFSRVRRGLCTPRRTRKKPGRCTFSRTGNIVLVPKQSRPANSGRPNRPTPTHHPHTARRFGCVAYFNGTGHSRISTRSLDLVGVSMRSSAKRVFLEIIGLLTYRQEVDNHYSG
jgi:hypothetical protein